MERHKYTPPFWKLYYGHTSAHTHTCGHKPKRGAAEILGLEEGGVFLLGSRVSKRWDQLWCSLFQYLVAVMVHYFLSSDGIFLDFFPQLASIASNPETSNLQQQPGCAFTVWSHHPFVDSSKSSLFQQGTSQFSSWGSPLAPFSRLLLSLWIANLLSSLWSNPPSSTSRFAADILHPFTSIANKVGRLECPQHQSVPEEHITSWTLHCSPHPKSPAHFWPTVLSTYSIHITEFWLYRF